MVTITERVTKTRVKSRYFPSSGIAIDVGGIISERSKKKTTKESMIDILSETLTSMRHPIMNPSKWTKRKTKVSKMINKMRSKMRSPFRHCLKANKRPQ